MKPTLRQLEYLIAIAETGTFSEAARRTFVSQPSLSAQIKDMESYLGATLFERGRRGALLTPVGEDLVSRARIILRDVETLRATARQSAQGIQGRVKLGVLSSIGPYLMPMATGRLRAAFPNLRLSIKEADARELGAQLTDGHFDIIISIATHTPNMRSLHIARETLYISTAPDDVLAGSRAPITLEDLKGRELLSLGEGHTLTDIVKAIAAQAGAAVSYDYEGTSLDALRQMATMAETIAIIPSLYAASEALRDETLTVRPIDHALARRDIALIWRAASPLAKEFREIGQVFRDVAADIIG